MSVDVRPPDRIDVWVRRRNTRSAAVAHPLIELVLRALATGFGAGLLLMVGAHAVVAEVATIGIIAIAAALVNWEA